MFRILLASAVLLVLPATAQAGNFAVLAGVTHYALGDRVPSVNLEGPEYDLAALSNTLRKQGFSPAQMTVLANQAATRQAILAALRAAVEQAGPGDLVLFYFSGHGTSAFDRHLAAIASAIGPNSGALVPYDFDPSSRQSLISTLVIGHRDLRPVLSRLNPQARALVILDACYSQNSARGLEDRGAPRVLDLSALAREVAPSIQQLEAEAFPSSPAVTDTLYPNVVSLAASSAYETALDMTRRLLATGRVQTVDNQPHGAFTNSLLKGLRGLADTDHDGRITVDELFRYTREDVRRTFPHTPQLLPARDLRLTTDLSFAGPVQPAAAPQPAHPADVALRLEGVPPALAVRLGHLPGITLTSGEYDLLIRVNPAGFELIDGNRTLIGNFPATQSEALLRRVSWHRTLRDLIDWHPAAQNFNLALDVTEPLYQGSYRAGQRFQVAASAAEACHLLLLDINPDGSITVLYPASVVEAGPIAAHRRVRLLEAEAKPPFGTDHLKLIAFRTPPAGLSPFTCRPAADNQPPHCPAFTPDTPAYAGLWRLLRAAGNNLAQATLPLVITE